MNKKLFVSIILLILILVSLTLFSVFKENIFYYVSSKISRTCLDDHGRSLYFNKQELTEDYIGFHISNIPESKIIAKKEDTCGLTMYKIKNDNSWKILISLRRNNERKERIFKNYLDGYCNNCLVESYSVFNISGLRSYPDKKDVATITNEPLKEDVAAITNEPQGIIAVKEDNKPAYCTGKATSNEAGGVIMPINPRFKNIEKLGQLFTAVECGAGRIDEIAGVNGENYTLGSTIWLKNISSEELLNTFQSIGYVCSDGNINGGCLKWSLGKTVKINDLMKLVPDVDNFKSDDCVICG